MRKANEIILGKGEARGGAKGQLKFVCFIKIGKKKDTKYVIYPNQERNIMKNLKHLDQYALHTNKLKLNKI